MAKQYVNEYLIDSDWDGDYFYIHKDNFDSSFQPNDNDMRAFMRALLAKVSDKVDNFSAVDKSKKMTITSSSVITGSGLVDTYSLKFAANIATSGNKHDVVREPFKVYLSELTDNANASAYVEVQPISAGDQYDDYVIGVGYVASKTVKVPTYDTDYDYDDGLPVYGYLDGGDFTLNVGGNIGTFYFTPWMFVYDHILDDEVYFYGPTKTVKITGSCFLQGTKITLADGSEKNVEDLTYNDDLLVWNFDEGKSDTAKPAWLSVAQPADKYSKVTFADGTVLDSTSPALGHRIYSVDSNSFVSTMPNSTPIGMVTVKEDGTNTTLVSKEMVSASGDLNFYGVLTNIHLNCYANGILTSYPMNNIYPMSNMMYVKDARTARNKREFPSEVSNEIFTALRLSEQPRTDDLNARLKHMLRDQKPKA
jgi:hypothetical protein